MCLCMWVSYLLSMGNYIHCPCTSAKYRYFELWLHTINSICYFHFLKG